MRSASGTPAYFISIVEYIEGRKKEEMTLRSLTPCEREVSNLLGGGLTNQEISERLAISARTVKFHVQNVVEKLGVDDRKQAAELAS